MQPFGLEGVGPLVRIRRMLSLLDSNKFTVLSADVLTMHHSLKRPRTSCMAAGG